MPTELYQALNSPLVPIPTGLEAKLPQLAGIRAVLFDIYGTLVVSGTGDISIAQAIDKESELRALLESLGPSIPPELSLTDRFYSLIQADHAASKSQGAQYPEVDILEIWQRFFAGLRAEGHLTKVPSQAALEELAIRFECAVNPVWPMPGLEAILQALAKKGIPIGIVSNAQFYTPLMLEAFTAKSLDELGFQRDLSVWSYRERLGKPSVELFEKLSVALRARNIAPEQALYVGNDMLNDIWTASQAGLKTALFAGDERSLRLRASDDRCQGLEPDVVLTTLSQLLRIL